MASINQDEDKGEEGQDKRTVRLGDIKESEDEAKAAVDKDKQAYDDV